MVRSPGCLRICCLQDVPGGRTSNMDSGSTPTHDPSSQTSTCCCCCWTWARSAAPRSTAGASPLDRVSRSAPHSSKWLPPLDPFWMADPLLFVSDPDSCIMTQKPERIFRRGGWQREKWGGGKEGKREGGRERQLLKQLLWTRGVLPCHVSELCKRLSISLTPLFLIRRLVPYFSTGGCHSQFNF